jgi:hypothetical protein
VGAENLAPTGLSSPGRPSRSQSLHRLRFPDPLNLILGLQKCLLIWDPQRILLHAYFMLLMRAKCPHITLSTVTIRRKG